jgi:hypothetical protein
LAAGGTSYWHGIVRERFSHYETQDITGHWKLVTNQRISFPHSYSPAVADAGPIDNIGRPFGSPKPVGNESSYCYFTRGRRCTVMCIMRFLMVSF